MKSWYEIYQERMNDRYLAHVKIKYEPFIKEIGHFVPKDLGCWTQFIEIGCGAGNITKLLREQRPHDFYALLDSCPRMLGLAIQNNPNENCHFVCADVTRFSYVPPDYNHSIVRSHGLLEHFSDEQIVSIITLADYASHYQFHYVPSHKYEKPSRGDERLLSVDEWDKILKKVDRPLKHEILEFNSGYDLILKLTRR